MRNYQRYVYPNPLRFQNIKSGVFKQSEVSSPIVIAHHPKIARRGLSKNDRRLKYFKAKIMNWL